MSDERNFRIDTLRALGTILLILAHVDPPFIISEIRTFDVVLLSILSGISIGLSNIEKYSYMYYLIKRLKRLVIPTYICLIFIFVSTSLLCILLHRELLYDFSTMLYSFIFSSKGMGYVWIVKVYLIMALFALPLTKINKIINNDWFFIVLISSWMILQFVIIRIPFLYSKFVISDYVYYVIPYVTLETLGIRWQTGTIQFKERVTVLMVVSLICLTLLLRNFNPSSFKYPPDYYYVIYGTTISFILLLVVPNRRVQFFEYISKNSFNIYLLHIIVLLVYNFTVDMINISFINIWWIKFIIVTISSIFLAYITNSINQKRRVLR